MIGQIKVITTQMKMANTSIWTMSVTVTLRAPLDEPAGRLVPSSLGDRAQEGVRECEEQRETDAYERDCVQEAGDDEHLHLQRRGQLRLARGAFQELAAEQAEANGGTESTEAEDQSDAEGGEALNLGNTCEIFHFSSERTD
jgi:hypothetical protein